MTWHIEVRNTWLCGLIKQMGLSCMPSLESLPPPLPASLTSPPSTAVLTRCFLNTLALCLCSKLFPTSGPLHWLFLQPVELFSGIFRVFLLLVL